MKNLLVITIFIILVSTYSHSEEVVDCNKFEKIKTKLDCKAKNLKTKLNENQSKAKKKVSSLDNSETGKKFKKSKLGKALLKFKNSKTGSDLFEKE